MIEAKESEAGRISARLRIETDAQVAKLQCLLHAARAHHCRGHMRLVNDGTYSGEAGVALTLAGGEVRAEQLDDFENALEELAGEIFEAVPGIGVGGPKINPFTGKLEG